jgi:hypothetical protein
MYPEHDDMGEAKDHKLQLEIDQQNRDSAINRAMAEVAGWKYNTIVKSWLAPKQLPIIGQTLELPDFVSDLNAVHEVENVFPHPSDFYQFTLSEVCGGDNRIYRATARQRCTAILKTLNRWNPEWDLLP